MKKILLNMVLVFVGLAVIVLPVTTAASGPVCLMLVGNSNCYLYGQNGTGIVIDAGADPDGVLYYAKNQGLAISAIILTHGHGDHVSSLLELKSKTKAKVYIHESDLRLLQKEIPGFKADVLLKGGEIIRLGGMNLEIIHTPGHTPGSICIKADNIIFSGDTLFKLSIGRTDFEGGSTEDIIASLKRLADLDERDVVCPGHGDTTTVGFEKANNPFLKQIR